MSGPRALRIVNARLWSDGAHIEGDALLIEHGRIARLGTRAEIVALAPHAREIDAAGATVTPALCDAHVHFVPWAQARRQPDLHGCASRTEALERVRAALASVPGDAPLVGRGWDESGWEAPPERAVLDALAPQRPVVLHRHDFHAMWVNSAALRAAHVTRDTPDPDGGHFERDAAGEPTGLVRENAVRAFASLEAQAGPAIDDALLDDAAAQLHAYGITSVHDFQREAHDHVRMRALAARRRLRVTQMIGLDVLEGLERAGLGSGFGDAWYRIGALKLFADGTLGSRTAAMLADYADVSHRGMAMHAPAELAALVARAARAGLATTIHAIGDRAVRDALDAFAALAADARTMRLPLPHRIEHVQLLDDADRPRFAALGVVASMQPQHCITDIASAERAWGERCARAYPWQALRETGATLVFGSDAPVEPPDPALGLHAAVVRRRTDGTPANGFSPQHRVPLDAALDAYTSAPARIAGLWPHLGTLRAGAEGDVVVWRADLHALAPEALAGVRPAVTVLGGEMVYGEGSKDLAGRTGGERETSGRRT